MLHFYVLPSKFGIIGLMPVRRSSGGPYKTANNYWQIICLVINSSNEGFFRQSAVTISIVELDRPISIVIEA